MSADVDAMLNPLIGKAIPGGCEDCNAEQTVSRDPDFPGVWRLTVHHDDACPDLRRRRERELKAVRAAVRRTGNPARRAELAARLVQLAEEMNE